MSVMGRGGFWSRRSDPLYCCLLGHRDLMDLAELVKGGLTEARNWELTFFLNGAEIRQPALFVAGEIDGVIVRYRRAFETLETSIPNLKTEVLTPGAGHWVQQERPNEVNRLLIEF